MTEEVQLEKIPNQVGTAILSTIDGRILKVLKVNIWNLSSLCDFFCMHAVRLLDN